MQGANYGRDTINIKNDSRQHKRQSTIVRRPPESVGKSVTVKKKPAIRSRDTRQHQGQ